MLVTERLKEKQVQTNKQTSRQKATRWSLWHYEQIQSHSVVLVWLLTQKNIMECQINKQT